MAKIIEKELLAKKTLPNELELDVVVPKVVKIYDSFMTIEYQTLVEWYVETDLGWDIVEEIESEIKRYDYIDLLVMNDALNAINCGR